jgi:hypothetical protein
MASALGILDLPSFVRVAYIHNARYLAGLIGLILAIIYVRKQNRQRATAVQDATRVWEQPRAHSLGGR